MMKFNIDTNKNREFECKGYLFKCYRVKNDLYGNPMYRIEPQNFNTKLLKGLCNRVYVDRCFGTIQSYDIDKSIERIFDEIAKNS